MVYHVSRVSNSIAVKTAVLTFIYKWSLYALICNLALGGTPSMWWMMLGMAFPAAVGALMQYRLICKGIQSYTNTFYTLTEGGLMMECDGGKTCAYFSWADVTETRRLMNHTVWLKLSNGKSVNCLLESLPEERIAEFAAFAVEHAGKTPPPSALTPPPAELTGITHLTYSGTPEQRREHGDIHTLLSDPAWAKTWLRPCQMLLLGLLLLCVAYKASYLAIVIVACIMWRTIIKLKHPAGTIEHSGESRPCRYYATARESLYVSGDKGWVYNRQAQPCGIYEAQHGICLADANGVVVMLDSDQSLPPHLQLPRKKLPRRLSAPVLNVLFGLFLLGAAWCFTQSNTWRMHQFLNRKTPDMAEALSLAKLPPDTKVEGIEVVKVDPSVNILRHQSFSSIAVILYFDFPDGNSISAYFDKCGVLVKRRNHTCE